MRISDWSSDVCSSDLIGNTVQIERHTAPAAADVEHTLARLEQQLGGDMGLLVRLRLFKRFVPRIGPIRAAILPVDGEKEIVEPVGKIVMRSEEGRVGKGCVSTCRSGWCAAH